MKKWFVFILVLGMYSFSYARTNDTYEQYESENFNSEPIQQIQEKNADYAKERRFKGDPKSKYDGGSFQYSDDGPPEKYKSEKERKTNQQEGTRNFSERQSSTSSFTIFGLSPYVFFFILIVVLAIIALLFGFDFSYLKLQKYRQKVADPLVSEEEDIDESDYERLLQRAIQQKEFRLATRYYYLWLLKKLSQKEYIDYHKDKTNSDYLFELKDAQTRSKFSYLSYIYSYVWYGEFQVDELKFGTIKSKYQSFIDQIK